MNSPLTPGLETVPLDEVVAGFLTQLRARSSAATAMAYQSDIALIRALIGADTTTQTLADLNPRTLQTAFAAHAQTHAPASTSRAWSAMNQLAAHATRDQLITGNPMGAVTKPKAPEQPHHHLDPREVTELIRTLADGGVTARRPWPIRDFAVIAIMLTTGILPGELLAMTSRDHDRRAPAITVTNRNGQRQIAIHPELSDLINAYQHDRGTRFPDPQGPAKILWLDDNGQPLNRGQLQTIILRAFQTAGIAHRPGNLAQLLRYTFAHEYSQRGAMETQIQQALGLVSMRATERYLQPNDAHQPSRNTTQSLLDTWHITGPPDHPSREG